MLRCVLLALVCLAGCQNTLGPLKYRRPLRVDDPCLTIPEQERLGRDRFPLPDNTYLGGPNLDVLPKDGSGR